MLDRAQRGGPGRGYSWPSCIRGSVNAISRSSKVCCMNNLLALSQVSPRANIGSSGWKPPWEKQDAQNKNELKMQKVRASHFLTCKPLMCSHHICKTSPGPSWGGCPYSAPYKALGPGVRGRGPLGGVQGTAGEGSSLSCRLSCCPSPRALLEAKTNKHKKAIACSQGPIPFQNAHLRLAENCELRFCDQGQGLDTARAGDTVLSTVVPSYLRPQIY